jgi:hypothetical protein
MKGKYTDSALSHISPAGLRAGLTSNLHRPNQGAMQAGLSADAAMKA